MLSRKSVEMPGRTEITPEQLDTYRAALRERDAAERRELERRRERAWDTARHAADLLRAHFGASKILAFGSLAHGYWFTQTSDIDMAAWGIKSKEYFLAVAKVQDVSPEIKIDLVRMEDCTPELRESILKDGKSL
jgi:predicted nucleotidyltransferase